MIRDDDHDLVFKALGDPSRRLLFDLLLERDGRTLTELDAELEMTRFGVMKHLRVLDEGGLVVTRKQGREKLRFLNPVPIRLIHHRWIDKCTERRVSALLDRKKRGGGVGRGPRLRIRSVARDDGITMLTGSTTGSKTRRRRPRVSTARAG